MSNLHVHRRRVPTQDFARCVDICVIGMAAGTTVERRLALAAFTVYGSTDHTGLRAVSCRDFHKKAPALIEFVGQQGFKDMPALIQDRPVQPGLGFNIAPRLFNRTLCTGRHASGLQILKDNGAKTVGQTVAGPMMPVLPDAGLARLQSCNSFTSAAISSGTPFFARQVFLSFAFALVELLQSGRQGQDLSRRQGECISHAAINTNRRQAVFRHVLLYRDRERDVPAIGRQPHGRIVNIAEQRSRISELDPAYFGKTDRGPFAIKLADGYFPSLEAKGVIKSSLPGRGIIGTALEKCLISLVQVTQCLLLTGLGDGSDPVEFCTKSGQLTGLKNIVWRLSRVLPDLPPPVAALFKGKVVDQATDTGKVPKLFFLFDCWLKLVLVSTGKLFHAKRVVESYHKNKEQRFLPGINAEVSALGN